MAQKHRYRANNQRRSSGPLGPTRTLHTPPVFEYKAPVEYGKPFIVAEDDAKNTFIYEGGSWVPYSATIAECKLTCQVKKLPQAVNNRTRYEVRSPKG